MMNRDKFQFSSKTPQRAEARRNAAEALAHLDRWLPKAEEPAAPEGAVTAPKPQTAAGQCFKRVTAILAGRGK